MSDLRCQCPDMWDCPGCVYPCAACQVRRDEIADCFESVEGAIREGWSGWAAIWTRDLVRLSRME